MEDFFKQQAGWLNAWQEQQQKLTQQYAKWGETLTQGVADAAKQQVPANFEDLLKTQQELMEQFTSFGAELQRNIQQTWGDKLPGELLKQFNFNILQEFYKNWLASMKFPGGLQNPFVSGQNWADPTSFLNSFIKQENPFFAAFSSRSLMDELQQLFGMLQGSKAPGSDLYSQFFTTWQGFFNQLANTGSSQGFDTLLDAFVSWKEQADQYLLAPQVGLHRAAAQDYAKSISLSLDYVKAFATMGKLIEETARKAGNRFQAKLVERSLNNEPALKFSEFCELWTKENEAVFVDVFGSKHFAITQNEFTSAGLRLKIQLNKLVEKFLDQTPVALKRDVDLAANEIIQLKRALRSSIKQQKELEDSARAAREAAEKNEKRIKDMAEQLIIIETLTKNTENANQEIVQLKEALRQSQLEQQRLATETKSAQDAVKASELRIQELAKQSAATQKSQPAAPTATRTSSKKTAPSRASKTGTSAKTTTKAPDAKTGATAPKASSSRNRKATSAASKEPATEKTKSNISTTKPAGTPGK